MIQDLIAEIDPPSPEQRHALEAIRNAKDPNGA